MTITWKDLVAMEPRLADLRAEVAAVKDDGALAWFCANQAWYSTPNTRDSLKRRMTRLVGDDVAERTRNPNHPLASHEAYDVAYEELYGSLPACRGPCGCIRE